MDVRNVEMDMNQDSEPINFVRVDENFDCDEPETASKRIKQDKDNDNAEGKGPAPPNVDENTDQVEAAGVNIDVDGKLPLDPVTKVLRNPMILTKILKKMQFLRGCRLVNLEWRDLSTDVLLKRKSLNVSLDRDDTAPAAEIENGQPQFIKALELGTEKNWPTLTQLTTLLTPTPQTHKRFPCVNFSFDGDLNCADAQEFLDGHGKNIKGLKLSGKSELRFFSKLLLKQAPNVESLELGVCEDQYEDRLDEFLFPHDPNDPDSNSNPPELPSLISLRLEKSCLHSIIAGIEEAAPNLEECTGFWSIDQIEFVLDRIHVLKELNFTPEEDRLILADWESLTEKNLQVKKMSLDYDHFEMNYLYDNDDEDDSSDDDDEEKAMAVTADRISSKLLHLNQRTLKELLFFTPWRRDIQIKWPILEEVEKLTIDPISPRSGQGRLRCPSLKISEHFPALKTLKFNSLDTGKSPNFFNGQATSVTSLLIGKFQSQIFDRCRQTFPNLSELSLSEVKDFAQVAPKIWDTKQLKSLRLSFLPCDQDEIDAGFTGMDKRTCADLFRDKSGKNQIGDEEIDKLRVNPSILDLTDLEFLAVLDKNGEGCVQGETRICREPSFVSYQYAFDLMPKLQVRE